MRVPQPEQIQALKSVLATLRYQSPGNSGAQGVPYHEIYFEEFRDTSTKRNQSQERLAAILNTVDVKNKVVFDLGCNVGYFVFGMAVAGAKSVGVDYDSDSIELANRLKEAYDVPNARFERGAITKDLLAQLVTVAGEPDIILLNSVMHWLLHAHDSLDAVIDVLSPLFSTSKEQIIFYEPSSTGAAYYPETLSQAAVERFFTSCGALEWKLIGTFTASNADQSRGYYLGKRNIPLLDTLSHEFLTSDAANTTLLGTKLFRDKKNGKLRGSTSRFFLKSHESNDSFAQTLLNNEARMVRAFSDTQGPLLIRTNVVDSRTTLIFRRETAPPLTRTSVARRDIAFFDLQVQTLLDSLRKKNIFHNDIMPENLLWCSKTKILRLVDFEFATLSETGDDLSRHFSSLLQDDSARLDAYLAQLGGRWKLVPGRGGFYNDRHALKSIFYSIKDRKRYRAQRLKADVVRSATYLYRSVVPAFLRRRPVVTKY